MKSIVKILLIPVHGLFFLFTRILPRRLSGRLYVISGILFLSALSSLSSCRIVGRRTCYDVAPADSVTKSPDNPPPGVKCYDRVEMPDSLMKN